MSKLVSVFISEVGISSVLLNTADAFAVNNSDVDVAIDSPERAPRVSHNVVSSIDRVFAIAHYDDCVVEFNTTSGGVKDTSGIELEN